MSSPLLDDDLRQMLMLRWQLCEGDAGAAELPYNAAWTRALLLYEVLSGFHDETDAGDVAGLVAPGEVAGLAALRDAARGHVDAMARQMIAGS